MKLSGGQEGGPKQGLADSTTDPTENTQARKLSPIPLPEEEKRGNIPLLSGRKVGDQQTFPRPLWD